MIYDMKTKNVKMSIPCVQKLSYHNNILIERCLPDKGLISVQKGQSVLPYTELGQSSTRVLLSGVWGVVEDILENESVLIKSQSLDLHLIASSVPYAEGELVVFPNPADLIQKQYFDKFSYSLLGKVIYVGNTVSKDIIQMSQKYGVSGVLAGGCPKSVFDFAQCSNVFLGLFTGFGVCKTPEPVFDALLNVSTRIVFASGQDNRLRIPVPENFPRIDEVTEEAIFKPLEEGCKVLVLQNPYFGFTGRVVSLGEWDDSKVLVKLTLSSEIIEVNVPNILALQ